MEIIISMENGSSGWREIRIMRLSMIITWMIIMIPLQQVVGVLRLQATNNDDNDVSIIDNHASNYEKK